VLLRSRVHNFLIFILFFLIIFEIFIKILIIEILIIKIFVKLFIFLILFNSSLFGGNLCLLSLSVNNCLNLLSYSSFSSDFRRSSNFGRSSNFRRRSSNNFLFLLTLILVFKIIFTKRQILSLIRFKKSSDMNNAIALSDQGNIIEKRNK